MTGGPNRYNTGKPSVINDSENYQHISIGKVVDVSDEFNLGRIKVIINGTSAKGGDNNTKIDDLPWCFPLLPKYLNIQPKVGESVFILTFSDDRAHSDRLYVGPIISQPQKLNFDGGTTTALNGFSFATSTPEINTNQIPALRGVFPDNKDTTIQGRNNTDILFKPNEILLRAGKYKDSTPTSNNPLPISFNNINPGFIQIKHNIVLSKNNKQTGSVANVVADKINLLTHRASNPKFNLTDQDDMITQDELLKILETAHPLPYGDLLVEYLILLKNAFLHHVHNGGGKPPTDLIIGEVRSVEQFTKKADELEKKMLSQNIRIN